MRPSLSESSREKTGSPAHNSPTKVPAQHVNVVYSTLIHIQIQLEKDYETSPDPQSPRFIMKLRRLRTELLKSLPNNSVASSCDDAKMLAKSLVFTLVANGLQQVY